MRTRFYRFVWVGVLGGLVFGMSGAQAEQGRCLSVS